MKAVVIAHPGGPEVLELRELPKPTASTGRMVVRVTASGVNRADLIQRRGGYPAPEGAPPDIPGLEYAGVVAEVGPKCHTYQPGERVMGLVGGGGYAEYVDVDEQEAVPVPDELSETEAGAVPEAFMAAFDALDLQMGLSAGESVLIHAVGSGVGTAAVQLAHAAGARTVGTSRTAAKLERARSMGLDVAVDGDAPDWPRRVLDATDGRGVDVILDLVGAAYLEGNLDVLAERGRWIVVGLPSGASGPLDLGRLMRKRASLTGTLLRSRPPEEKASLARAFADRVLPLLRSGAVVPVLDGVYPAARAAEAHRRLEANTTFGKLVLTWEDGRG